MMWHKNMARMSALNMKVLPALYSNDGENIGLKGLRKEKYKEYKLCQSACKTAQQIISSQNTAENKKCQIMSHKEYSSIIA